MSDALGSGAPVAQTGLQHQHGRLQADCGSEVEGLPEEKTQSRVSED